MDLKNKNILITQLRLLDFAGSEIITLELAEFFSRAGASVKVVTNVYGNPIKAEFDKLKNVEVLIANSETLDAYLDKNTVDIIWVHHQIIPQRFIVSPGKTKFIFHHMSPYAELEQPNFWNIESALADIILCNSQETKDKIVSDGMLSGCEDRMYVFGNPAPDDFVRPAGGGKDILTKLLVVSNHVPSELDDALQILKTKSVKVSIVGSGGDQYQRLLPEVIAAHEAVVSIGKTVVYAIVSGVPVYCYDRFGGPGYLQPDNFEKARELNFSGRGFERAEPEDLADSIIDDYKKAKRYAKELQEDHAQSLTMSHMILKVLKLTEKKAFFKKPIDSRDVISFANISMIVKNYVRPSAHQDEIQKKRYLSQLSEKDEEIENIRRSWNYKVGRLLLAPVKAIKKYTRFLTK